MPYIGNKSDTAFTSLEKQDFSNPSGTSLTLVHAVANANDIALYINNVRQEPTEAYSVNGTTVTLTGSVSNSDDIYAVYLARAVQTTVPPDGSVSTAKIANSAVDLTTKVTGVLPVANGGAASIPIFQISSTASQSISHNTSTQLTFNTANIDTHSITDVANNKVTITAATAGYYMLHAKWTVDNTSPFRSLVAIAVNGTTKFVTEQAQYSQTQSTNQTNLTTGIINLVNGDDITVNVLHGYGSARNSLGSSHGPSYNFLQGFRITT